MYVKKIIPLSPPDFPSLVKDDNYLHITLPFTVRNLKYSDYYDKNQ